jgi:anti-sigma B factor antagonist
MRFEESTEGNILIAKVLDVRIGADVAPRFKEDMIGYVKRGNHAIVLDLSNVSFIDSSGLGALISCLKSMGSDRELVLCGTRGTVTSMFKLTRMDKVFRMFSNSDEAVSALSC